MKLSVLATVAFVLVLTLPVLSDDQSVKTNKAIEAVEDTHQMLRGNERELVAKKAAPKKKTTKKKKTAKKASAKKKVKKATKAKKGSGRSLLQSLLALFSGN